MNYVESVNDSLNLAMQDYPDMIICGQLAKWGSSGVTEHLWERYPTRVITMPVSEALMNASAMGIALTKRRVVMIHERMDFVAVGMDALINHIPIIHKSCGVQLPLMILAIVGKGHGQGPQHSKNLTHWFRNMEGWTVFEPQSLYALNREFDIALSLMQPVFFTLHRELFDSINEIDTIGNTTIRLCGASSYHEKTFYK